MGLDSTYVHHARSLSLARDSQNVLELALGSGQRFVPFELEGVR